MKGFTFLDRLNQAAKPSQYIYEDFGKDPEVSTELAERIKSHYNRKGFIDLKYFRRIYGISRAKSRQVLAGGIEPYCKGKLPRLPLRGLHPDNALTVNQRLFVEGVIGMASYVLDLKLFEILCNSNSLELDEGFKFSKGMEKQDEQHRKYRDSLRLQLENKVEEPADPDEEPVF